MKTKLIRVPRFPAEDSADALAAAGLDPAVEADAEESPIVAHPDGYYWVSPDGRRSYGPFRTAELARVDRDSDGESELEPGETLQEAEADLGLSDWIDPDTGVPAEGLSTPHLVDD